MLTKYHPFHMVTMSPWPLFCSMMAGIMAFNLNLNMFFKFSYFIMFINGLMTLMAFMWWKDILREVHFQGFHNFNVLKGLKLGMILFITSEIMFFLSFFWSFFHFSLSPNIELGQLWPPMSINSFNPINVPLLNTIVLISSGVSVTWSHHSLLNNNFKNTSLSLSITWMLGFYFSMLQYMEYYQSEFNISDSSYGSIFFMSTGFHGMHVLVGSMYLLYSDFYLKKYTGCKTHFLMLEMAAWYWHFVDVIWLFLYLCVYWWGK